MTDDDKVEAMALARCARCHHFNDADRMVVVSYNGATGAVCRSTCRLPEDVIVGELVDLFVDVSGAMIVAQCGRCGHYENIDRMVPVDQDGDTFLAGRSYVICRSHVSTDDDVIVGEDVTVDAPDAREVIARILHQHGPTPTGPATDDWRDCPSADIHGDVAMRIADALGFEVSE